MNIVLGIIIGFILGIPCAIGATLYGLTNSNVVGEHIEFPYAFIDKDDPVTYHEQKDTFKGNHSR